MFTASDIFHPASQTAEGFSMVRDFAKADSTAGTFLQELPATMVEQSLVATQNDWLIYLLLSLLAGFAIIVFSVPEKLKGITFYALVKNQGRASERNVQSSGAAIQVYLILNYLVATSLFVLLIMNETNISLNIDGGQAVLTAGFAALLLIFYFYRLGVIRFLGLLFKTRDAAYIQQRLYISTDFILGIVLIPVLLLSVFLENMIPFFTGILLVIFLHIFRWLQTFILGKSISGVSAIHLIVYLCTLEIAPLIVVIKLMQTL